MVKKSKIVAIVATLVIAAAGVITFEACNKKNDVVNNTENSNIVTIAQTNDMDGYLIDLRKRMKTATKYGETMSLSDAEWALTALENFGLCDGSKRSTDMIVDTVFTKVMINDGNISLYELNLAYENNRQQIINKFNFLNGNDKNIYLIKSTIDDSSKNGTAEIRTIISMRNGGSMPDPMRFGSTDYWYDFDLRGKCGPYEGQCVGRDATTEMISKVSTNIGEYACPNNGRIYYTNVNEVLLSYNDIPYLFGEECEDSPYPPECLYANWTYFLRCLSPDELNWYLDKILEYIHYFEEQYNQPIVSFDIDETCWVGIHEYPANYTTETEFWLLYLTCANVNCTQQPYDI